MIVINALQGSDEWLAIRGKHHTASEAPAMLGMSKKTSRAELLRMKATGSEKEFSAWVLEVLFAKGHEVEAKARPIAESIIGEDLYPITATDDDGYLLASFDGVTMSEKTIWECKQWNEEKAQIVGLGAVPDEDLFQVVQQMVISKADHCLYMVTDGTPEKTATITYTLEESQKQRLLGGWEQFASDVEAYNPPKDAPEITGTAPESLPALRIEVTGMVTDSNLAAFKETSLAVIGGINTDLQTDADFADAEKTVKWCADVETRLEAAKNHALSQTASIDDLFKAIDEIKEIARQKRLEITKLVKTRKDAIRFDILKTGKTAFEAHIEGLNKRLGNAYLPQIVADFASAMKGRKTVDSLRNAVDTELARVKIEANAIADKISINLESLRVMAADYKFLFNDIRQIITKDNDDLIALVKMRIAEHQEEEKRKSDEAERLRLENEQRQQETAVASEPAKISPADANIPNGVTTHNPVQSFQQPANDVEATAETIKISLINNGIGQQSAKKIAALLVGGKIKNVSVVFISKTEGGNNV